MSVIIGSARIGENGSANYGRSGDQTGGEVSKQEWYKHSKMWYVLRPKKEEHANKIAFAMNAACDNDHIGYSQNTRYEAWDWCRNHNTYNPQHITENVNTDCSALVRLCLAYAGIFVDDFYTGNEKEVIMETGCFIDASGTASVNPEYLKAGDILVTQTKGHTVVVLTSGSKMQEHKDKDYEVGVKVLSQIYKLRTVKIGMEGPDVLLVQEILRARGYKGRDNKPLVLDGQTGSDYDKSNTMFAIGNYIDDRNKHGADLGERTAWGPKCWADQNLIKAGN